MTIKHHKSPPQFPPDWAEAWGEDRYGLWLKLLIGSAEQIFRWIEPGDFLMGSPDNEPERRDNEVQHNVTFTQGFWMADTAVTQELWLEIMGDNPSYFKGKQRPVENVSWEDSQQFIKQLNQRINIYFSLPEEAQWEYACRAGTQSAFSFGKNIRSEQVNYNADYPYAGGKKGQYREETVEVKTLPCNDWGLYEMHGNVWEWCQDCYQEKLSVEPVTDPKPHIAVERLFERFVVRGGSWGNGGGRVRSAMRYPPAESNRYGHIGFRFSLGQISSGR